MTYTKKAYEDVKEFSRMEGVRSPCRLGESRADTQLE